MKTPFRQRGLSGLSLLTVLLLIGFFATVVIKILPIYMESWTIKGAVTSAIEDSGAGLTPKLIRKSLERQFTVNMVTAITVKEIEIKRQKGGKITVDANYEKRVPFMQNVDVVVRFEKFNFEVQGK